MSDEKLGAEQGRALTREQAVEFAERWFDRKWGNDGQYQSLMETMVKRLMELREPGAGNGEPKCHCTMDVSEHCPFHGHIQFATREPGADTGIVAREEALFRAANTAAVNLVTSMNLREHPDSCECYGCGLNRAVVNFALARARENVRPIVERELQAERWPGADKVENNRNDTMEYWRSRAIAAEQKVLEFHAQIAQLPGADTGTTPPRDAELQEAYEEGVQDGMDEEAALAKTAERGTTPPEGLRELVEKSLETQARMNEHANALHDYFAHSTETTEPFDWIEYHRKRVNDLRVPATQRAPVTMRNCGICGKPFRDDDGKGFCICVLD